MTWTLSPFRALRAVFRPQAPTVTALRDWYSHALERVVAFDLYLPPRYDWRPGRRYPLVIFNDGQDLPIMHFSDILENLYRQRRLPHLIAVGVYANHDRLREYGTAGRPDYRGRGDRAGRYRDFLIGELLPWLYRHLRLSGRKAETALAGFSLGGLSALDTAWHFPDIFGAAGVFSGALWWRSAPVDPADPDADRIMHDIIAHAPEPHRDQRLWFQCGTADERADRNHNGVIDAIDDTLHLLDVLRALGQPEETLRYLEIEGGEHAPHTWGQAMPDFLQWTFNPTRFAP
jgi:enterochelin esterase-like enzyme